MLPLIILIAMSIYDTKVGKACTDKARKAGKACTDKAGKTDKEQLHYTRAKRKRKWKRERKRDRDCKHDQISNTNLDDDLVSQNEFIQTMMKKPCLGCHQNLNNILLPHDKYNCGLFPCLTKNCSNKNWGNYVKCYNCMINSIESYGMEHSINLFSFPSEFWDRLGEYNHDLYDRYFYPHYYYDVNEHLYFETRSSIFYSFFENYEIGEKHYLYESY